MSIAEAPPISKKLQPLEKWYLLFPTNWVELALDHDWRTKRIKLIHSGQGPRYFSFWAMLGVACLMVMLAAASGFVNNGSTENIRSKLLLPILFANSIFMLVIQSLYLLKFEVERILLQLIDHLETEDDDHV